MLRYLSFFIVGLVASGCGAKTGLRVPDAALDAPIGIDAGVPCVLLPGPDAGTVLAQIEIVARPPRADVVFVLDVTGSMGAELDAISAGLRDTIAPALDRAFPDSQIGVATFADFPVGDFGSRFDRPFSPILPVTGDIGRVQAALQGIELSNGGDAPEAQVEALYQLMTGEGLGSFVSPSVGCPRGGDGAACLRQDALPVVFLFTDAPFHEGPRGDFPYDGIEPFPHVYDDAVRVLGERGVRVIGFDSGDAVDGGGRDLAALARDTDAVGRDGLPLVYDIGASGESLDTGVVDAIESFAESVVFDVSAFGRDPDPTDGVDPSTFVVAVHPASATPRDGFERIEGERFLGVRAGTSLTFELELSSADLPIADESQIFELEIVFRGDDATYLGSAIVKIVVPGRNGEGCPPSD